MLRNWRVAQLNSTRKSKTEERGGNACEICLQRLILPLVHKPALGFVHFLSRKLKVLSIKQQVTDHTVYWNIQMYLAKNSSLHLDSVIDFFIFYMINLFLIVKELAVVILSQSKLVTEHILPMVYSTYLFIHNTGC